MEPETTPSRPWWKRWWTPRPARTWGQRIRGWLVDAVVLLVAVVAISFWQGRSLLGSGEAAPAFRLVTTDGASLGSEDLRGRKTLLAFWAPWCGVCGAESDNLSRIQAWLGGRVRVVSVVLDARGDGDVARFMADQDVDYPVLVGDPATAAAYRVRSYPTLYVLDADGHIEHAMVGYTTTLGLLARLLL